MIMTYLLGVDVSSHQPNWEGLKDNEYYGWAKATEGTTYFNPEHDHQIAKIREEGKVVGHYHWLVPGKVQDQLDFFISKANVKPGDLVALDWEDSDRPSCADKDEWIQSAQDHFGDANKVGLYCNRDWWINRDTTSFAGDYLWIAVYGEEDPGIEYDWTFWQYTASPYDKNYGKFDDLAALKEWCGYVGDDHVDPPSTEGLWYSTDYLFPMVKPDPTNPNKIIKGDHVEVQASSLKARTLPGGPQTLDKYGEPLLRPLGYEFDVTGDLVDGWVTGGTNWYSSDHLMKEAAATKPGWNTTPKIICSMDDVGDSVSYLQAGVRVAGDADHDDVWIVCQDLDNQGNTRFGAFDTRGELINGMLVKNGGHGQTFHAYRSSAGNLYIWTLIGDYAYRIKWQPGKTVSTSSSGVEKMAYGTARPVGTFEHYVGFRSATDTKETLTIHDRFGFTDPDNYSDAPIKKVTLTKRNDYTQQSWAVSLDRVYRLYGKTNETPGSTSGKHVFDVFNWSGDLLLDRFDIRNMFRAGCDENEPEGISFTGEPGEVVVGMREGPASASKRDYVWWLMKGLP